MFISPWSLQEGHRARAAQRLPPHVVGMQVENDLKQVSRHRVENSGEIGKPVIRSLVNAFNAFVTQLYTLQM